MNEAWTDLLASVAQEADRLIEGGARWTEYLANLPAVRAVLNYGSGVHRRAGHVAEGRAGDATAEGSDYPESDIVEDFYLLVDSYRGFGSGPALALAGRLLPPNVYFYEMAFADGTRRCKCSVMRVDQFLSAARGASFTPQVWARFAQPFRIAYTDTQAMREELLQACAESVVLLYRRGKAFAPEGAETAAEIWKAGLRSTYADELRSERSDYIDRLYERNARLYDERARLCERAGVADWTPGSRQARRSRRRVLWARPARKAVVAVRFAKAAFTFEGGLAYAQWKIRRQSGVHFELSDFDRRHPFLGGLRLFARVLRARGLR